MTQSAPAGWYPQPDGTQRYWDGTAWTERTDGGSAARQSAARKHDGIRWLGVRWGRSGRPGPSIGLAIAMVLVVIAQVIQLALSLDRGSTALATLSAAVILGASVCGISAAIDAHFARRVAREQA